MVVVLFGWAEKWGEARAGWFVLGVIAVADEGILFAACSTHDLQLSSSIDFDALLYFFASRICDMNMR